MLSKKLLRKKFSVYLDMLDGCARKHLYWPALHILVIIPDICGALESEDGKALPPRYKAWCKRYVVDPPFPSANEWYDIRCKLLHQGRTLVKRGKYKGYRFSLPDNRGNMAHRNVFGRELNLDVSALIEWVKQGLNMWFIDISENRYPDKTKNVKRNLPYLIKVTEKGKGLKPYIKGTNIPILGSIK